MLLSTMLREGDIRKTMAARGLVNGRVPTKWEGFSFPNVTLPDIIAKEIAEVSKKPPRMPKYIRRRQTTAEDTKKEAGLKASL